MLIACITDCLDKQQNSSKNGFSVSERPRCLRGGPKVASKQNRVQTESLQVENRPQSSWPEYALFALDRSFVGTSPVFIHPT